MIVEEDEPKQELMRRFRPAYDFDPAKVVPGPLARLAWRPSVPQAVVVAALFVTCVLSMNRVREFLYFQF